jgi:hypothetical protein
MLDNATYRADVERLLETCAQRNVAVQTIKSVARRRWADQDEPHYSWYEPLTDADAIARAVRFVLARAPLFLNTSSDLRLLRTILEAASTPGPAPTDAELVGDAASYGIAPLFDGGQLERI